MEHCVVDPRNAEKPKKVEPSLNRGPCAATCAEAFWIFRGRRPDLLENLFSAGQEVDWILKGPGTRLAVTGLRAQPHNLSDSQEVASWTVLPRCSVKLSCAAAKDFANATTAISTFKRNTMMKTEIDAMSDKF